MRRLLLIAKREYLSFLRTPGFWLSLLIAPLVAGLASLAPAVMEHAAPVPRLAVVDLTRSDITASIEQAMSPAGRPIAILVAAPPEVRVATTPDAADAALRRAMTADMGDHLDAAAVLYGPPERVSVDFWSRDLNDPLLAGTVRAAVLQAMQRAQLRQAGLDPRLIDRLDAAQPTLRTFSPKAAAGRVSLGDRLPSIIGLGMAFALFFVIFTGAGILLNSVIEEKSNRVLEILLSSASVPEILGGKILGVAGLSATVMTVWGLLTLAAVGRFAAPAMGAVGGALVHHGLIVWFVLFFVGGYVMYASMFAAIGSFCETVREAQTLLGPLMLLMTIPIMFLNLALEHPDAPLVVGLSLIPPFAPFLMTARLAAGPPAWQALCSLILMGATAAGVVWVCARAFAAGALSTGKLDLRRLLSTVAGRQAA